VRDIGADDEAKLSPEAMADLRQLTSDHAINADLIHSLTTSQTRARAHLKFFKNMMIISNGSVIFAGAVLAGFGLLRLSNGFSVFGLICLIAGSLLFVKFSTVFISMNRALRATEAVAKKHDLI